MDATDRLALDRRIGESLKRARVMRGMSQTRLGRSIGVTFQQIQKYERGDNRIAASALFAAAAALDVPIAYFFDDEAESEAEAVLWPSTRKHLLLLRALQRAERDRPALYEALCGVIAGKFY
ncbi:MAG: helix-turn-helix transcriptional regulator [Alphaproteobacteria bacterium]